VHMVRMICIAIASHVSVKTPSKTQMNKQGNMSVCLFVRCIYQGRPSYGGGGGTNRNASQKFKGQWDKNPRSTNKYTNVGYLIIRKIIKILPLDVTF